MQIIWKIGSIFEGKSLQIGNLFLKITNKDKNWVQIFMFQSQTPQPNQTNLGAASCPLSVPWQYNTAQATVSTTYKTQLNQFHRVRALILHFFPTPVLFSHHPFHGTYQIHRIHRRTNLWTKTELSSRLLIAVSSCFLICK